MTVDVEEFARRLPGRPLRLEEFDNLVDELDGEVLEVAALGPETVISFTFAVDGDLEAYTFDEQRGRWLAWGRS